MKDGLSHCPHSIEVALMGDAAGDAIKTRWQRVRQAIGAGDAARVSTMDAGAMAARRSPKPQTGVRVLRILHMATTGVVAKKTENNERYEDIKLLRVWRHADFPARQWRGERQHHRMGVEPVRHRDSIGFIIEGVKERLVKFIHSYCVFASWSVRIGRIIITPWVSPTARRGITSQHPW